MNPKTLIQTSGVMMVFWAFAAQAGLIKVADRWGITGSVKWTGHDAAYTAMTFDAQHGVNPSWSAAPEAIQKPLIAYNPIFLPAYHAPGMSDTAAYVGGMDAARNGSWDFNLCSDTGLHPDLNSSQGLIWNNSTFVPKVTTLIAGLLILLPFATSTIRILRRGRAAWPMMKLLSTLSFHARPIFNRRFRFYPGRG